ncbi:hypothetical protein PBY51_014338 [Eleginops maclovinus]|uniref:Uncharacterized protein n=1 Tax=Eleginops maclovinus TaxID=56733 RepID=A0AAN7WYV1_ELEMC|nr:hypothetical protein PBY51_014338 [Eleginops maclovinus]
MRAVPCDASDRSARFQHAVAAERPSVRQFPPFFFFSSLAFKVFANTAPDWMGNNCALQTSLFKPPSPPPPDSRQDYACIA